MMFTTESATIDAFVPAQRVDADDTGTLPPSFLLSCGATWDWSNLNEARYVEFPETD